MADLELALNLTADSDGLRGEVRLSKGELDKLTKTNDDVDKSGRRAGKGLDDGGRGAGVFRRQAQQANQTGASFKNVLNSIAKAAGYAAGLLGGISLAVLIGDMTQTIFAAEQMQGALLSAVGGIPELADKAFAAIEQFASRTPFALDQSVQAFIKMQNLGIRPTEERMAGFGNTAAAMGKDLNQMIEAVADASTGEFERLKEFGIKANQEGDRVRFTFQGVTTEVAKNSDAIVGYLTDIGNTKFGDAMANQMERLPGLWSNLKDTIDGIWRDLGSAGVTDMFASWLAAGIEWTGSIRAEIKAGWFDWVGAELNVLSVKFSGWWDRLASAGQVVIDQTIANWKALFSFLGTDAPGAFESITNVISFAGDAIAQLPINIQTMAAIAIGEVGKISASIDEFVFSLVNSGQRAWETLSFSIESVLLLLKQKAGEAVEYVINKFGELVGQLSVSLAEINSTSVGDALISDSALASLTQAGVAMQSYAGISQQAAQDIATLNAEHEASVTALNAEQAGIEAAAAARKDAANDFIDSALEQREAVLANQAAAVQEAEAAAAAARSSYEHKKALEEQGIAIDDVTKATEAKIGATEKEIESLDKLLDRLDPARVATRRYEEGLEELTARLKDGTISEKQFAAAKAALTKEVDKTKDSLNKLLDRLNPARAATRQYTDGVTELRAALASGAISQYEFNTAIAALQGEAAKAVGGVLTEAEALETAWKRGIERIDDTAEGWLKNFLRTGELTFSGVKDLFLDMLAEMIYAAARNKIVLGVTTSGVTTTAAQVADGVTGESGGSGLISAGSSLYSLYQGGIAGLGTNISTGLSSIGGGQVVVGLQRAGASFAPGAAGVSQVAYGAAATAGAGVVGGYLGQQVFQNENSTGAGAAVGGVVGAYLGSIFPVVGTAIGAGIGSFVGEGLEKALGKVFGWKEGGDNRGFAEFDLATGDSSVRGSGKNITQANLDQAEELAKYLQQFADEIGGSDFAGSVSFGTKSGIEFQGQEYKNVDSFLQDAFRAVISGATDIDDEVKTMLVARKGDAQALARDAVDALSLQSIFNAGETYFAGINDFNQTFETLVTDFRRKGEAFGATFLRLETGLAVLIAAGADAERSVANFTRAQELIDRIGLEAANNILYTANTIGDGISAQFQRLQDANSRSNPDIYETQVANNRELIAVYDGTAASSLALAQATLARRESEFALLTELEAVTASVSGRIASFREQLILDGLDDAGQYNRYRDQIADLADQLATAGSAAEIERLTSTADSLGKTAYGLLNDKQQNAARPEFIEWLDAFEELAQGRIEELRDTVVATSDAVDIETQTALWEKAGLASENMATAASDLQTAGETIQDGGEALIEAARELSLTNENLEAVIRLLREMQSLVPQPVIA